MDGTSTSKPPRVKPLYWRVGQGEWHEEPATDLTFRRSAPPVAQQCKACRRAKAARKRVRT